MSNCSWLELSEELAHDPEELLAWSQRAVTYIATLPPKVKRASKKTPTKKSASTQRPVKAVLKKKLPKAKKKG